MEKEIREFIVNYIEKKGNLPKDIDINTINYIEAGYVDSMGIIKFVVELEQKFDIQISDDDMMSQEFKTIGGLIQLIKDKINK